MSKIVKKKKEYPKIWKNLKKKTQKITVFERRKNSKKFCGKKNRQKKKKNAFPLVLTIEEISLRPELSSPASFRFQGGYPERDGRTNGRTDGGTKEILVSYFGCKFESPQVGMTSLIKSPLHWPICETVNTQYAILALGI